MQSIENTIEQDTLNFAYMASKPSRKLNDGSYTVESDGESTGLLEQVTSFLFGPNDESFLGGDKRQLQATQINTYQTFDYTTGKLFDYQYNAYYNYQYGDMYNLYYQQNYNYYYNVMYDFNYNQNYYYTTTVTTTTSSTYYSAFIPNPQPKWSPPSGYSASSYSKSYSTKNKASSTKKSSTQKKKKKAKDGAVCTSWSDCENSCCAKNLIVMPNEGQEDLYDLRPIYYDDNTKTYSPPGGDKYVMPDKRSGYYNTEYGCYGESVYLSKTRVYVPAKDYNTQDKMCFKYYNAWYSKNTRYSYSYSWFYDAQR